MKPFSRDGGPGPNRRPVVTLTAIGGVHALLTNPVAWTLDPCVGCIPWPNRYASEPGASEAPTDEPAPLWGAGPAGGVGLGAGTLTSGGGGVTPVSPAAPVAAPAAGPVATIQPVGSQPSAPTCPAGQVLVNIGGGRTVCKLPWGR